jgi:hypothetical protein
MRGAATAATEEGGHQGDARQTPAHGARTTDMSVGPWGAAMVGLSQTE